MRTTLTNIPLGHDIQNGSWLARGDETGAVYLMVGRMGTVLIPGKYPADRVGKQLTGGGFSRLPTGAIVILAQ